MNDKKYLFFYESCFDFKYNKILIHKYFEKKTCVKWLITSWFLRKKLNIKSSTNILHIKI